MVLKRKCVRTARNIHILFDEEAVCEKVKIGKSLLDEDLRHVTFVQRTEAKDIEDRLVDCHVTPH